MYISYGVMAQDNVTSNLADQRMVVALRVAHGRWPHVP